MVSGRLHGLGADTPAASSSPATDTPEGGPSFWDKAWPELKDVGSSILGNVLEYGDDVAKAAVEMGLAELKVAGVAVPFACRQSKYSLTCAKALVDALDLYRLQEQQKGRLKNVQGIDAQTYQAAGRHAKRMAALEQATKLEVIEAILDAGNADVDKTDISKQRNLELQARGLEAKKRLQAADKARLALYIAGGVGALVLLGGLVYWARTRSSRNG
jgi:hypothetical protein